MPRNSGCTIDLAQRLVRDRDGCSYSVDGLVSTGGGLYYERPIGSRAPDERAAGQLFYFQQRWVLPAEGWVVNRFAFFADVPRPIDWYIETEIIDVSGSLWHVHDGYLDVDVFDGIRYEVEDAGELADGLLEGAISAGDAASALASLDRLCLALGRLNFSGAALLAEYAPELPAPGPAR